MQNNVIIIGGGPTGLCLSLALAARGLTVDLVERQSADALSAPEYDGREVALTHASIRLLLDIGVWEHIPLADTARLSQARVMDGADTGFAINGHELDREQLGRFVSNHAIRAAAWKAASSNSDIRIHTQTSVDRVDSDENTATVHLSDERTLEAPLLIAADGRFSQTRRSMGIATHMHDFGKTMLLCRMQHTLSNHNTACEWFGQGQTRALLALETHLTSIILTIPEVEAKALQAMPTTDFEAAMAERLEHRLGDMKLASTVHAYPLVATWARRFVGQRFALVGDAAVGMHPVTAHGFNLALASVEHLARTAGDGLQYHDDPGHARMLKRYERRHRTSSTVMFLGTQAVADIFTSERHIMKPLRHAILKTGKQLPPLRRALAANLIDDSARPRSIPQHARKAFHILRPRLHRGRAFKAAAKPQ